MVKALITLFLIILLFPCYSQQNSILKEQLFQCTNDIYTIPLFSTQTIRMTVNRTHLQKMNIHTLKLETTIENPEMAQIPEYGSTIRKVFHLLDDHQNDTYKQEQLNFDLNLYISYINKTYIHYFIEFVYGNNKSDYINCSIIVTVSQPQRMLDKIFRNGIPIIITIISIQMGILLDLEVLKELMRRPIQILIGFVCQYGLMPLIAFSITKIFRYDSLYGLGLFVVGCCPGGSASNQWTVMFDGDLNLSAFMSFASTLTSFIMMPIWLYTLGEYTYLERLKIRIPFDKLGTSLFTIVGPLLFGMILVYWIPKLKVIIKRIVKPILLITIIYFFVFGSFANFYLLSYLNLRTALTAPLLPWLGFILGSFAAWICGQDRKRTITIGIETGIQNIGIAFMVLLYSLPSPQNTQSTIIPLVVAYVSFQPLYFILAYRWFRQKCLTQKTSNDPSKAEATVPSLSDHELESQTNLHFTRKLSIPMSVVGLSPDSQPLQI